MPTAVIPFERPATRSDELAGKPGVVRFLAVPDRRCVMIDGEGRAGEAAFAPRMPGLYATAYTLRFALKRRGVEEKVGPLEGLWWTSDGTTDLDAIFGDDDRATWRWTLLIGLPGEATDAEVEAALEAGRRKLDPVLRDGLRVERFAEGEVAQVLHVGPYAEERASIERLHAAIADAGLAPRGRHHELYLGDPAADRPGAAEDAAPPAGGRGPARVLQRGQRLAVVLQPGPQVADLGHARGQVPDRPGVRRGGPARRAPPSGSARTPGRPGAAARRRARRAS